MTNDKYQHVCKHFTADISNEKISQTKAIHNIDDVFNNLKGEEEAKVITLTQYNHHKGSLSNVKLYKNWDFAPNLEQNI